MPLLMGHSLPAVPRILLTGWYDHIRDGVSAKGKMPEHVSGISDQYEAGAQLAGRDIGDMSEMQRIEINEARAALSHSWY